MRRSNRRAVLFVVGLLSAFGPLSMDTYLPALPRVVSQLGTQSVYVQISLTASLVGLGVGQLLAGPASDRHGRRPIMLLGVAGFVLSSVLCAVTPDIWLLILFRLAQGCCGAAGIAVSRAVVRDLYAGPELTRVFSRLLLVNGAAPVVAPIIGAQILRLTGWRGVFWVLAAIGLLILVLTAAVVPETLASEHRSDHRAAADLATYGRIARDWSVLPYLLSATMFNGVLFCFISGSSFVIQKIYGHSPTVFSLVFAAVSATTIALGQLNARLAGRRSVELLTRVGICISMLGAFGVLLISLVGVGAGIGVLVVALMLAVAPNGVVNPNTAALAMRHYRQDAGAVSGLIGVATFLAGGIAAPLVGVAGEHTMVPLGIVMATCTSSSLLLLVTLERRAARLATNA